MAATSTRRYAAKAVLNRYWNRGDCAVAKGRPARRWVTKVAVTGAVAAAAAGAVLALASQDERVVMVNIPLLRQTKIREERGRGG